LIERAKIVLGELEGTLGHAAGKNSPEAKRMVSGEMQLGLFGPEPSVLDEAVKDLDPENMTPMEALAKVRELKDLI
jgi:DNA mismatch repair ATPase MutS